MTWYGSGDTYDSGDTGPVTVVTRYDSGEAGSVTVMTWYNSGDIGSVTDAHIQPLPMHN